MNEMNEIGPRLRELREAVSLRRPGDRADGEGQGAPPPLNCEDRRGG